MAPLFRPARSEDLQQSQELVVASINDLTERHGFGPMASVSRPDFQSFSLGDDPDGLWIAEEDGRIVGSALSWVCGDLWFLAELFVAPGCQGRGIGNGLLARSLEHASRAQSTNRGLITFTFNVVSQSLYIRHGLSPRLPIYMLSVERERMKPLPQISRFDLTPIEPTPSHLRLLAELDRGVLGVSREKHHLYLLRDSRMNGVLLHEGSDCVGYAYVSEAGHVGPLAVGQSRHSAEAFRTAMQVAASDGAPQLSAFMPGESEALRIAIDQGMRIRFPLVLMSERAFGDWTRYLPRNPGFM